MRTLRHGLLGAALTVAAGASLVPQPAQAAPAKLEKIAVVDTQRVLMETKQGRAAKKDLEKAMARSQSKLERKANELQKQFQDLQAKAAMLSQSEVMRRQQELEQLYNESSQQLAEKEALLAEKIYRNVQKIVKQMALEDGIQIVLARSSLTVLYAAPALDLTNKVIVAYDKKHK